MKLDAQHRSERCDPRSWEIWRTKSEILKRGWVTMIHLEMVLCDL
jgi:hypothetical protein